MKKKIKLKHLSFSDLISLKSYILWCRENMEDTVDDFDEKQIYREDFRVKLNAIEMEIFYKKEKINFNNEIVENKIIDNTYGYVKVKKAKIIIKKALDLLDKAKNDKVEFKNCTADFKINQAEKLIEDALKELKNIKVI